MPELFYPLKVIYRTQAFGARPWYYKPFGLAGHEGDDFRARTPQQCYAVDDGEILSVLRFGAYGLHIYVKHAWGTSCYAHLSQANIAVGTKIFAGQPIPGVFTGNTAYNRAGRLTPVAAHLHFGMKVNGRSNPAFKNWVPPSDYLKRSVQ